MKLAQSQAAQRGLFVVVTIMYWISMYIYVPILSPYLSSLNYSLKFVGIVLASYGFIQLLFRFPIGILSDTLGKRKPFIIVGMISTTLSCLLFLIPNLWVWPLLGRAVAGICASTWVAFTVMYASQFSDREIPKAMGQISLLTVVGQMIGMLLSGWLTDLAGSAAPFVGGAIIGLIGLLLALFLHEPRSGIKREHGMSPQLIGEVIRTGPLLRASWLSILAHGVLFITMFGFTPLKATELGASGTELTLLVFCFMLPHALAAIVVNKWFIPTLGAQRTILLAFVVSSLCTLGLIVVPSLPWMYATQALNGFAQGLHLPLFLSLAIMDVKPQMKATAMGLYQAIYAIGMFSGPFIAGYLNKAYSIDYGFALGGVLAIIAAGFVLYWMYREKSASLGKGRSKHEQNAGA